MSPNAGRYSPVKCVSEAAIKRPRTILFLPFDTLQPAVRLRNVEYVADERKTSWAGWERETRGVRAAGALRASVDEGDIAKDGGGDEHV